jgi:hypothetical protein
MLPAPPEVGIVVLKGAALEVHRFKTRMITRTTVPKIPAGIRIEVKQGNIEPLSVTEVVPVVEDHWSSIAPAKVVIQNLNGKPVAAEDFPEAFEKPTPILIVSEGTTIDPLYQKVFQPDSFVLILPNAPITTFAPNEPK